MFRAALVLAFVSTAWAASPALMPMPVRVSPGAGELAIANSFRVEIASATSPRLTAAVARFTARLSRQTGIPFIGPVSANPALRIECAATGPDLPTLGEDESYTLVTAPEGAVIKAPSIAGAQHALETFLQLAAPGPNGFAVPAVHIEDRPRFPWRGLMIDSGRHFMPVDVIQRNLDAMAAVKLNVFHWHLSEDQGFRVESRRFPKLHELGSDGLYYTQDQIRGIVAYARDRGIRVVPEFDMPGHTTAWFVGYPDLASAPGPYEIMRRWGISENAMDPSREETYAFLDELFAELTPLFPDPYWHIGGDEVMDKQWNASPRVQAFAKEHNLKDAHAIQAYFNQRVQKLLQKRGKILIGWDEVLHPDLPTDIVVQSWRGQKSLAEAAAKGYRGILSWGYYLDHLRPASYHYGIDPIDGDVQKLSPEQQSRILGGEACMWAEYVTAETIDSRIWPRAAAIAERYWSPAEMKETGSMYARMDAVSRVLEYTGVEHRSNYLPMLDRLAGGKAPEALRVLADAVEGLGLSQRARARTYTSLVPMNRLADAARPESESVREMEMAARNPGAAEIVELRARFAQWAANDAKFRAIAGNNPMLSELQPLSQDLSALGALGLKLLDYVEKGQKAPADFVAAQTAELTRMQRPNAEVSLAAVRPLRILLDSVK
jgi:hexosaminidase